MRLTLATRKENAILKYPDALSIAEIAHNEGVWPAVRGLLVKSVESIGDQKATPGIIGALHTSDAEWLAIQTFGMLGGDRKFPASFQCMVNFCPEPITRHLSDDIDNRIDLDNREDVMFIQGEGLPDYYELHPLSESEARGLYPQWTDEDDEDYKNRIDPITRALFVDPANGAKITRMKFRYPTLDDEVALNTRGQEPRTYQMRLLKRLLVDGDVQCDTEQMDWAKADRVYGTGLKMFNFNTWPGYANRAELELKGRWGLQKAIKIKCQNQHCRQEQVQPLPVMDFFERALLSFLRTSGARGMTILEA